MMVHRAGLMHHLNEVDWLQLTPLLYEPSLLDHLTCALPLLYPKTLRRWTPLDLTST